MNEEKIRHQQANWFLGGTLLVVSTGVAIAISMARAQPLIILIGFGIGSVLCWAVNKFIK